MFCLYMDDILEWKFWEYTIYHLLLDETYQSKLSILKTQKARNCDDVIRATTAERKIGSKNFRTAKHNPRQVLHDYNFFIAVCVHPDAALFSDTKRESNVSTLGTNETCLVNHCKPGLNCWVSILKEHSRSAHESTTSTTGFSLRFWTWPVRSCKGG